MTDYSRSGNYEADVIEHALRVLLWSETDPDNDGRGLFERYGTEDVDPVTRGQFADEVRAFLDLVEEEIEGDLYARVSAEDMGHNFVLSKNGHGTGFWDAGLGDLGDQLHKWAKTFGETMAYVGNDGHVYIA